MPKMSSRKFDLQRDFATGVYLSEAQNPILPPLTHCTGRGGGGGVVELVRRGEGQQFTKLGRKYQHDWLYLQSINSKKRLLQSPFTGQFFLDGDILFWCLYSVNLSIPSSVSRPICKDDFMCCSNIHHHLDDGHSAPTRHLVRLWSHPVDMFLLPILFIVQVHTFVHTFWYFAR